MRLKTYMLNEPKHTDLVSCATWATAEEVVSCGDDHQLILWNVLTHDTTVLAELPQDLFPTDLHCHSRSLSGSAGGVKKASDIFVLTATDGKYHFVSRAGRIERSVDAHKGAVLAGRWSHDGTALLTAGEDGQIKIWSRSGMLRSTLCINSVPVYSVAWGPNSDQVLYTLARHLVIKSLTPNSKPLQWKAHDGLILKVAWNQNNNLIISGGEDCKYKVWDSYGRVLYISIAHDYPITSVAWSPDGQLFAVGSFNTLRLCDKSGWSYSLDKPQTQSIFGLAWSGDGTQLVGACGNGHVIFAHVIERRLEWKNFEATVTGRKAISVKNVTNDTWEKLDFRDHIIKVSFAFGHLLVVTSAQCYIYSVKNWNTPQIFDLKEGNVSLILQADRHFLLVDGHSVYVYGYEGKLLTAPRWIGMRPEILSYLTISISSDTLAVRDSTDEKVVHFLDSQTGKPIGDGKPYTHTNEIVRIALDQCGRAHERKLVFVDKNRDLYITAVRTAASGIRTAKIGGMVQSLRWNDSTNMLAAVQDGKISIWYYPSAAFVDRQLMSKIVVEKDISEFGKNPHIISFLGNHLSIRRADGSVMATSVSPYPAILHGYVTAFHWDDAIRLCRFVKDSTLWACLAAMALGARELNTAEVAYAAIDEVDKVHYIQHIKKLPIKEAQQAEIALLCGSAREAENILLQAGLIFRAIMMNLKLYNWARALDIATKYKVHIDTVLAYRKQYLDKFDKEETNKRFLQLSKEVLFSWEDVKQKVKKEYEKEGEK